MFDPVAYRLVKSNLKGKRILIIDDDKIILESLSDLFNRAKIESVVVTDILDGQKLLETEHFDCVISDINFRRTPNERVLKIFAELTERVPIIVFSGAAFTKLPKISGLKSLLKGHVDLMLLLNTINEAINEHQTAIKQRTEVPPKVKQEEKKIRLLIVDDELFGSDGEATKEVLERAGPVEVIIMTSVHDAQKYLAENNCDIILSDLLLGNVRDTIKFFKFAIEKDLPVIINSGAEFDEVPGLRELFYKYSFGFLAKGRSSKDRLRYILNFFNNWKEEHHKKEINANTLKELELLLNIKSHIESAKGTQEDIRALVYEARELDSQIRDNVYGNKQEYSKRELEQMFHKLQELKARIREYYKSHNIQRQTKLENNETYRDRDWNKKSQVDRLKENRQNTPLRLRHMLG